MKKIKEKINKIDWKARVHNPMFWISTIGCVVTSMLCMMNMQMSDLTTWASVGKLIVDTLSNPFVLFSVIWQVFNSVIDFSTKGLGDKNE